MANDSALEKAAASVLTRAVELDTSKRFTEALVCYQEGLQLLLESLKAKGQDDKRKSHIRQRVEDYMSRAEVLKRHVDAEKKAGSYHEQMSIADNSSGHSYDRILGRFLDDCITRVEIEDPYVRSIHQVYNLLRLCELLVKKCQNLKQIYLLTGKESGSQQETMLEDLTNSLKKQGISLTVQYSSTLHDREIRFDNGWIVKIGRGLDYFKAPESKFCLGYCDMDLRPCHSTTVDIFHRSNIRVANK